MKNAKKIVHNYNVTDDFICQISGSVIFDIVFCYVHFSIDNTQESSNHDELPETNILRVYKYFFVFPFGMVYQIYN